MKLWKALAVFVVISAASAAFLDYHPLSDENIALINQKAKTWKAGKNFEIHEWDKVKRLASSVLPESSLKHKVYKSNPHNEDDDIPDTFDAREAWPKCDSIKQIRDQSGCGSGWAFGAVEAMSDRICIHSNQTKQVYVSTENLIACCHHITTCGLGCLGGFFHEAWNYWQSDGIVTGGLYNSSQGCQDYSFAPCEHYIETGSRPQCSSEYFDTPKCVKTCYEESLNYKDSLTYGQEADNFRDAKEIQSEIYKNGPVSGEFLVYDDFPSYKSGVYQATSTKVIGRHAIKIIGWGTENNVPYWLIANSWNEDWGDSGYFKFLRGVNHCGIETIAVASIPV